MTISGKRTLRHLGVVLALALAAAGCDRIGGMAPVTMGGDGADSVVVNPGDSLYVIARRHDVPLRDLIDANRLKPPYIIEPGQRLVLPRARQYIVRPGDTLYGVSRMFSVDVSELTRLNNMTPPYNIRSGQALRLPSPAAGSGGAPADAPPTTVAAAPRPKIERSDLGAAPASPPVPVPPPVPVALPAAPFNAAAPSVTYQGGQEPKNLPAPAAPELAAPPQNLALPGRKPVPDGKPAENKPGETRQADAKPAEAPPPAPSLPPPEPAPSAKPQRSAAAPPPPAPAPAPEPAAEPQPPPRAAAGRFLTPVKGTMISGFGPKAGGLHNDGVNIAAPRGTPVQAADNGVVAYAGNELRGFGNLLLIRHADGWVTAYAHLERIDVERGAEVKRGQRIGAVGQSGGVPAPQLHFELRKGSQAVDPKGMM